MKLQKYLDDMKRANMPEELRQTLMAGASVWTNDACYGYIIMAMEDAGFSPADIDKVLHFARDAMDFVEPEKAEARWRAW